MKLEEHRTLQEVVDGGEKVFFAYGEDMGLSGDIWADADELVYTSLVQQAVNLLIELCGLGAALVDVAQDQGVGCFVLGVWCRVMAVACDS